MTGVVTRIVVAACVIAATLILVLSAIPMAEAVEADAGGGPRSRGLALLTTLFWLGPGEIVDETLATVARAMILAGSVLLAAAAIAGLRRGTVSRGR